MGQTTEIEVEVVYALPGEQVVSRLRLTAGATIEQAIRLSGLLERYPEITLETVQVGIFGQIMGLQAQLSAGNRVEIYRPLKIDPKEARRKRVKLRNAK